MRKFNSQGTGTNLVRNTTDGGINFIFNTGHAYREHRSGVESHPQRAGTPDIIEDRIVDKIQQLMMSGVTLPDLSSRNQPLSQSITINSVTIQYRVGTVAGDVRISDYWALP
jgi:hypothetical protein